MQKVKHGSHGVIYGHILIVQQEFASLDDASKVYKLVGPVLLKQDTAEAKSTVDSRLDYIGTEM